MAGYGVGNIIFTRQDWNDKDIFTILTAHGDKFLSHLLFMHVHLPPAHLILSMLFKKKQKNNVYTVCMHGHILSSLSPKFNNISIIKKWCVSQHFFHYNIVLTVLHSSSHLSVSLLTYTWAPVRLQSVPAVTPAYGAVLSVLADVLAASIAMVTSHCKVNNMQLLKQIISST